jgi:hypothetical protein
LAIRQLALFFAVALILPLSNVKKSARALREASRKPRAQVKAISP